MSGFSNKSLQTNDLPRPSTSSVPKYDQNGQPIGLYIYGVEAENWRRQLDAERHRSAAVGQGLQLSRGYLVDAERQAHLRRARDINNLELQANDAERAGYVDQANIIRARLAGAVTGGLS